MSGTADAGTDADVGLLGHLNLIELSRESTRWGTGGAIEESDGVMLFATGSWLPVVCNGVFRTDDETSPADVIRRADAFFGGRRRGYTVMVRDGAVDRDLRRACQDEGLVTFGEPSPEMICTAPVAVAHPDGIDIRPVTTEEGVADFAAVTGAAYSTYGMPTETAADLLNQPRRVLAAPHLVAMVAYGGDEPLAAAMTLLSHGIAGLYWVGTVEKARRSGLGRAVTAAVTNTAFDRGATVVTLQASVMGEPVYRSMGYRSLYHYEDWIRFPASWTGKVPLTGAVPGFGPAPRT